MADVRDDDGRPTSSRASRWPRRNPPKVTVRSARGGAVDDAAQQVHAGRPVDRDDRNLEVEQPFEQRGHAARAAARWRRCRAARRPRGRRRARGRPARPRARPRPGRAAAMRSRSSAPGRRRRGHPDRHIEPVQRAGQHPAVTAVVSRARRRRARRRASRVAISVGQRRRRPRGRRTPSAWPARCRRDGACGPRRRIGRG